MNCTCQNEKKKKSNNDGRGPYVEKESEMGNGKRQKRGSQECLGDIMVMIFWSLKKEKSWSESVMLLQRYGRGIGRRIQQETAIIINTGCQARNSGVAEIKTFRLKKKSYIFLALGREKRDFFFFFIFSLLSFIQSRFLLFLLRFAIPFH